MKKPYKTLFIIFFFGVLLTYGIYWAFFDIQHIKGHEILQEVPSPSGKNTVIVYLNNGGATTAYSILCSVKDSQTGRERNIYWQYRSNKASVQWIDDDTVTINNVELNVWEDSYDYRNTKFLSNSQNNTIRINYESSFFHDFYVQEDNVKIRCELSIYNTSEEDIKFYIKAKSFEDVNTLLSKEDLIIKDVNNKEKIFELKANEARTFEVFFGGEYGGTCQKKDRNLPDIITFEIIR